MGHPLFDGATNDACKKAATLKGSGLKGKGIVA
jgi:hypothetical protein